MKRVWNLLEYAVLFVYPIISFVTGCTGVWGIHEWFSYSRFLNRETWELTIPFNLYKYAPITLGVTGGVLSMAAALNWLRLLGSSTTSNADKDIKQ